MNDKKKQKKVILVGINHAGTTALKSLVHNQNPDEELEIIAYDRNDNISFLGCGIALWVRNEFKDSKGLFYATPEKLKKLGPIVKMKHEMVKLDAKNHMIYLKNLETGAEFTDTYDKLILAIGSWPILNPGGKEIPGLCQLDVNGNKIPDLLTGYKLTTGVLLSKLYQHAQSIKKYTEIATIRNVVVIGAGYIGIELVEAFSKAGKNVTLIDFENRIMPRYYDAEFTNDLEQSMIAAKIKLQLGETLEKIVSENEKVQFVVTNKGKYAADLVIMAVGFLPNTQLLKASDGKSSQIALDQRGAIMVDEYFCTSDPDIYAIGDCINIYSNAWKKDVNIALATNAIRSGLVAGLNIAKNNQVKFPGVQGTNAISVFEWKLAATGLSEVSAAAVFGRDKISAFFLEDTVYPPFMQENHQVKIKIVYENATRRIIGAQIAAKYDHSEAIFLFSLAIMKQVTIDELSLVDLYFLPHFNKPYNYISAAAIQAAKLLGPEDTIYPDLRSESCCSLEKNVK